MIQEHQSLTKKTKRAEPVLSPLTDTSNTIQAKANSISNGVAAAAQTSKSQTQLQTKAGLIEVVQIPIIGSSDSESVMESVLLQFVR